MITGLWVRAATQGGPYMFYLWLAMMGVYYIAYFAIIDNGGENYLFVLIAL